MGVFGVFKRERSSANFFPRRCSRAYVFVLLLNIVSQVSYDSRTTIYSLLCRLGFEPTISLSRRLFEALVSTSPNESRARATLHKMRNPPYCFLGALRFQALLVRRRRKSGFDSAPIHTPPVKPFLFFFSDVRTCVRTPPFPFRASFQKRSKGYVKIAQSAKDALATRRKKKPLKT